MTGRPFIERLEDAMPEARYAAFNALDPFFKVVMEGLSGLVDGEHYFDAFAEGAVYESRYNFPGWPQTIRGRVSLMAAFPDMATISGLIVATSWSYTGRETARS